ncbi:heme-binding protein [Pseudomonas helleri]|uniref:heme-binding protein n=1 Tax=Pseudomonas helleri TaxID=1608996 RepID=UPI003FD10B0A
MFKKIGVTTLLFLTLSGQAFAADKAITSTQATSLAQNAVSIGLKQGYNVAVTVVDANGVILATVRADQALPHTPKTSFKKPLPLSPLNSNEFAVAALVERYGLRLSVDEARALLAD